MFRRRQHYGLERNTTLKLKFFNGYLCLFLSIVSLIYFHLCLFLLVKHYLYVSCTCKSKTKYIKRFLTLRPNMKCLKNIHAAQRVSYMNIVKLTIEFPIQSQTIFL